MSILSQLNRINDAEDTNILAALNRLTGKEANDIEEAVGNLGGGGSAEETHVVFKTSTGRVDMPLTFSITDRSGAVTETSGTNPNVPAGAILTITDEASITNARIGNTDMPYKSSFVIVPATEDDFDVIIRYGLS